MSDSRNAAEPSPASTSDILALIGCKLDEADTARLQALSALVGEAGFDSRVERLLESLDADQLEAVSRLAEAEGTALFERIAAMHGDDYLAGIRRDVADLKAAGTVDVDGLAAIFGRANDDLTEAMRRSLVEIAEADSASPRPH